MNVGFVNDPINCPWIKTFDVKITIPWIFDPFAMTVHYTMDAPGHPEATLSIVSSDSLPFLSGSWVNAETHPIPSNQASDHFTVKLNEKDLNKFWAVKVSYNLPGDFGQSVPHEFIRQIFFAEVDVNLENGDNKTSLFPEKEHSQYKDRIDTGVCFSGGGTRSLLLSMGQMRFLHNHGYAKDIGYYSSVSGGSWAASIYTFARENNIEALLGTYSEISEYKTLIANSTTPSMAYGADKGNFLYAMTLNLVFAIFDYFMNTIEGRAKVSESLNEEFVKLIGNTMRVPFDRLWIESVGWAFFRKNGLFSLLNAYEESFTLDQESKINQNPGSLRKAIVHFYEVNASRENGNYPPYYIANSLMLRPTNEETGEYIPYEYTPLYQGAGFNGTWKTGSSDSIEIGGGNIPMFAYNTEVISKVKEGKVWVMRQSINSLASLATASGTSSSAFAGATSVAADQDFITWKQILEYFGLIKQQKTAINNTDFLEFINRLQNEKLKETEENTGIKELLKQIGKFLYNNPTWLPDQLFNFITYLSENGTALTPKADYFSPKLAENDTVNTLVNFGDAGLSDNFGLMALLRREVKKVIVFVNSGTEFKLSQNGETYEIDESVQAFFGIFTPPKEKDPSGVHLNNMKVFEKADYQNLEKQLIQCLENKETLVATTQHHVLPNQSWDVTGGYDVEVMWYYNCRPENWEKQVDSSVIDELDNKGTSGIGTMPFYETFKVTIKGASAFEINMAANIAEWNLTNTKTQLDKFLGK